MKSIFIAIVIIIAFVSSASAASYEHDCKKNYHGFIVEVELEEPEGGVLTECMIWSKKHQAWIGHEMNAKGIVLYRELSPKEVRLFQKDKENYEKLMQEEADRKNSDRYDPILEVQKGRLR